MKGVILAGGSGTRLLPLTRVTNKHLLPVYDRPMVCFPLHQLVYAGLTEVLVVTGDRHADDFREFLGDGSDFGVGNLQYAHQEGDGGIADALSLAEDFAEGGPLCVILGDNIFQEPLKSPIRSYPGTGAQVFLKSVPDPERFGVARLETQGESRTDRVVEILEKPADPPSDLAVTGCYIYDASVFEIIGGLEPSARGELEITDVNNRYIEQGAMTHSVVEGWWSDAGTIPSLHRAASLVADSPADSFVRSGPLPGAPAR